MEYPCSLNLFCLAATHDVELADLLKAQYENFHFGEQICEDAFYFDYQLKPGASTTGNAIVLREHLGVPARVVKRAEHLVKE